MLSTDSRVAAAYADGGCLEVNPSPHGGTWAWCHVDVGDERVRMASGTILADDWGGPVTNNQMEFVAAVLALEALPEWWGGRFYTDSQVTIGRLFQGWRLSKLPAEWIRRGREVRKRLGIIRPILLDGHPTREQLAQGRGKRGNEVSRHNVWCDRACADQARLWRVYGRARTRLEEVHG